MHNTVGRWEVSRTSKAARCVSEVNSMGIIAIRPMHILENSAKLVIKMQSVTTARRMDT